ncbi:MAG: DUF1330 domain-containing protein [bacterium]|nr:DUF1330 domain-containing protein [bacterium]MDE0501941.1 DUF1330 domain-containing protein [bacterium]
MLGYVIVNTEVTDEEAYAEFTDRIVGVVETYGGKYLVRGGKTEHKYGEWQPGRVVVIEFASLDQARTFADSAEFAELRDLIDRSARARMILAEGV